MKYVTSSVAVAPIRKEASHRSEMTSQLLLNEVAEVLETQKQFTRIKCLYDGYEGWCANNQLRQTDETNEVKTELQPFEAENIRQVALQYLDVPYLWGGKSFFGIDCSGFCQQVFRHFGINLPRDAYQQAEKGEVVGFLQEVVCGDLAFFDNEEGRITHVGLMLNTHEIIHASGKVRIDKIDHQGIINSETGVRTHQLRIIKRYKKP
jgi:gamma-D-glutamyl-L-lysine dipeptidyl-peptidase